MKIKADEVIRRKMVVKTLRFLYPNYSYCGACGLPWNCCEAKTVKLNKHQGVSHTCQVCWDTLSLKELKKVCTESHYRWNHTDSLYHLLKCVEKEFKRTRGNKL